MSALILLLLWLVARPLRLPTQRKVSTTERRQRQAVSSFMQHTVHAILLRQQDYATLLPRLHAATPISAGSFRLSCKLRLQQQAAGHTVAAMPELRRRLSALAAAHSSMVAIDPELRLATLEALVSSALRHVDGHELYGRPIELRDCVVCGLGMERGAPFPLLHTDTEWSLFPGHEGFQLWYLLERDCAKPSEGNMFLATAAAAPLGGPPTAFHVQPGGEVLQVQQGTGGSEDAAARPTFGRDKEVLATYRSVDECDFSFRYLDLTPGDCLLMNRHQLHMSDPRPHLAGRPVDRLALTLRVIVKPPGTATVEMDHTAPGYRGLRLPELIHLRQHKHK